MKTLDELYAIRDKVKSQVDLRRFSHDHIMINVAMSQSALDAGARAVLIALSDAALEKALTDKICVIADGNLDAEGAQPVIVVSAPGKDKVTYNNVTPDKALEILNELA